MKVLFLTNIPSPYRVDFFNELGKQCQLSVTFEGLKATDRNDKWLSDSAKNFDPIYLRGIRTGSDNFLCPGIVKILKRKWDAIIVGVYFTPTSILAIEYMNHHHIKFFIEQDGGFIKDDNKLKYLAKKHFISSAYGWFSSADATTDYLVHYGAKKDKCYKYPFTSLKKADINDAATFESNGKKYFRDKLGMIEENIVLSVGRFSYESGYGKGYDVILKAAEHFDSSIGVYIVGDEPTEEFVKWKKEKNLNNVYFVGFKTKEELKEYYAAADVFVLMTKSDVWGLVINEAMAFGLPVITTDMCIAGLELVKNDVNGYIIPVGDEKELCFRIKYLFKNNRKIIDFNKKSREIIANYSIEFMAVSHIRILNEFDNLVR